MNKGAFCKIICLCLIGLFIYAPDARAQLAPVNDDCNTAQFIPLKGLKTCGDYSSLQATPSGFSPPACFSGAGNDVWFSFTALGTEANIAVFGAGAGNYTLKQPEAALYHGDCAASIEELRCVSGHKSTVELIKGGLFIGERYLIRIQGVNGATGTFQMCITNYNPPATFDADCITGPVLCDKSPFGVHTLTGAGKDNTELNDAPCFSVGSGANAENASTWFKWTCDQPGTLTFKLTPFFLGDSTDNLGDDIDFAVYELPNGVDNCKGKTILRCEAAGPYIDPMTNTTLADAKRCMGATGLSDSGNGVTEPPGCDHSVTHTNFLQSLQMQAGHSYALGVNNFSNTGNGFSVEFGGTGTFLGPKAKITINKADKKYCLGENVIFSDKSTFALGQIVKRHWVFGNGASIDTINGAGPFSVYYKTPGWKAVILAITTDRGCVTTTIIDSIYIAAFQYDTMIRKPTCSGGADGMIRLRVTNCGRAPISYNWEKTGYTTVDSISHLSTGLYQVVVTDSSAVYHDTLNFQLKEFQVELDPAAQIVLNPRCFGQTDGIIQLKPITGKQPFRFNWFDGRGYIFNSSKGGLGEGQYNVDVVDSNQCHGSFSFNITVPPLLQVSVDTFNITCFGRSDGKAVAHAAGGVGGYSYNWSNGSVNPTADGLAAKQYELTVIDSNGCQAIGGAFIRTPPELLIDTVSFISPKCYGDSTASLSIEGSGGTPPYRYSIDGVHFKADMTFSKIPALRYAITIRDSTGCKTSEIIELPQPEPIQVSAGPDVDVELGFTTNLRAIVVPSNNLYTFLWSPPDSISCIKCPDVRVGPTKTTTYHVAVRDTANCAGSADVVVRVIKNRPIYIPNVFTPNHDGLNDFFTVFGNQSALFVKTFKVFNRWGGLVYSAENFPLNDERVGWDGSFNGQPLPPDVFAYFALVHFVDGEEIMYKGDVTLIR